MLSEINTQRTSCVSTRRAQYYTQRLLDLDTRQFFTSLPSGLPRCHKASHTSS